MIMRVGCSGGVFLLEVDKQERGGGEVDEMDEVSTYLCFGLMARTSSVCECLEGVIDLIAYDRLEQESWYAFV